MSSNRNGKGSDKPARLSIRSWLRSLTRPFADASLDRASGQASNEAVAASPPAGTSSGADMISFHHTMQDVDAPILPPPRISFTESSGDRLTREASAPKAIPEPIATPDFGATNASQNMHSPNSLEAPSSPSVSLAKSPSLSRTLSNGVSSFTDRLQHERRASETYRRMRSTSGFNEAGQSQNVLSRSLSKTSDGTAPLVTSPSALDDQAQAASPLPQIGQSSVDAHSERSCCSNARGEIAERDLAQRCQCDHPRPRNPETRESSTSTSHQSHNLSNSSASTSSTSSGGPSNELLLPEGEQMLKVTHKKVKPRTFKLDPDRGQILWESKKNNRVNLESIREVRFGPSAASYRTSLNISSAHEPRWLTIIYQNGGIYKALHLIALSDASLSRWRSSLLHLQTLRRELTGAVGASGSIEHRRHLWMRHHWKDADQSNDEKLSVEEVMQLCRRLGIESNKAHLRRCFNIADWRNRGYLDFEDFQRFVSLLKQRADVQRIFAAWADQDLKQFVKSSSSVASFVEQFSPTSPNLDPKAPSTDASSQSAPALTDTTLTIGPEPCRTRAISIESFRRFIREEQGNHEYADGQIDDLFRRHCNSRFSASNLDGAPVERVQMDYDGFLDFLASSDNPPLLDQLPLFSTIVADPVEMPVVGKAPAPASADASLSVDRQNQSQQQQKPSRAFANTTEELIAAGESNSMASTRKVAAHLRKSTVQHDMTRPISEYYISSSHNTYLVGGQWKGDSTVEGYIRALLQGARSVELDCWDGPNNVPQITHGRTFTSRVPFQDVISAISRYAFVTSPYPLILSLEVHADPPQQEVMARILKDTLGDLLLFQPISSRPGNDQDLPSPEDLKYKVLIKAKNISLAESQRRLQGGPASNEDGAGIVAATVLEPSSSATDTTTTTDSEIDSRLKSAKQLVRRVTRRSYGDGSAESGPQRGNKAGSQDGLVPTRETNRIAGSSSKQTKKLMSSSLASLLIYTVGVKCRGFNKKEFYAVHHMVSLSEKTAMKMIRDPVSNEALIKHNRTHLTRVYPSMTSFARLHSSRNFVPLDMWATGCQLVALNWQTTDLGFELNQAMFGRNGRCGYVLKPTALRTKDQGKTLSGKAIRFALDMSIISAQQLPKKTKTVPSKDKDKGGNQDGREPIDPFVVVSLLAPDCWGKQPKGLLQKASRSGGTPTTSSHVVQSDPSSESVRDATGSCVQKSADAQAPQAKETSSETPTVDLAPAKTSSIPKQPTGAAFLTPSVVLKTPTVKGNGFSPEWDTAMSVLIDVPAGASSDLLALVEARKTSSGQALAQSEVDRLSRGLLDLCFVRFEIFDDDLGADSTASGGSLGESGSLHEQASRLSVDSNPSAASLKAGSTGAASNTRPRSSTDGSSVSSASSIDAESVAAYAVSVGALQHGFRHLPLYDSQLSQFLFSTLFIHSRLRLVGAVDTLTSPAKHA